MLLLVINEKLLSRLQASHLSSVGYPQTFCHNLKEYSHFFGEVDQNVLSLKSLLLLLSHFSRVRLCATP